MKKENKILDQFTRSDRRWYSFRSIRSKRRFVSAATLFVVSTSSVNATFSIVAIDPETGEVGSAGATCINNFDLIPYISYIVPGKGAANFQAYISNSFFPQTSTLIQSGQSADAVMATINNADSFVEGRQRLIITLQQGQLDTAAYTGSIPRDSVNYGGYANTIEGANYALGGNILIGHQVLTAMKTAFESTTGNLARKLMLSLRAAGQIVGADERCLSAGTSSASAYLRVAQPTDALNQPSLNLHVDSIVQGIDPVEGVYAQFIAIQPVVPVVTVGDVVVNESDAIASVRVTLSEPTTVPTQIGIHTRSFNSTNAAMGGSDFYGFTRQLSFAAGATTQLLNTVILNDDQVESDEIFGLRLYNAVGLRIDSPVSMVTIKDDDAVGVALLSVSDATVFEGKNEVAVQISLSAPVAHQVNVQIHTRAESARGGQDYYGFTRTITFAPGTTQQTVSLTVIDDAIAETPSVETLKVRLFNPDGAGFARQLATITINDDD